MCLKVESSVNIFCGVINQHRGYIVNSKRYVNPLHIAYYGINGKTVKFEFLTV